MNTDERWGIKVSYLKDAESHLRMLFFTISHLLDAGNGATHSEVLTLSLLAMNISSSLRNMSNTAQIPNEAGELVELPF